MEPGHKGTRFSGKLYSAVRLESRCYTGDVACIKRQHPAKENFGPLRLHYMQDSLYYNRLIKISRKASLIHFADNDR